MKEHRLLIIEDDDIIAELVTSIAQQAGFSTQVISGDNVVETYHLFQPHVIILDILMPGMDGFEMISYLRGRRSRAHILLLSGDENYLKMAKTMAGKELSIIGTISKPFNIAELKARMAQIKADLLPRDSAASA